MILGPKQCIPALAAARMQRWALLLAAYTYDICFRPTQSHGNADALSRLPVKANQTIGNPLDPTVFNIAQLQVLPISAADLMAVTRSDPILSKVLRYLRKGWPEQIPDTLLPYWRKRNELTLEEDSILWGIRVVVPKKLREWFLDELHLSHPGVVRMKALAHSHVWWPELDRHLEDRVKSCMACQSVKQAPPKAPLHPWAWPTAPWKRIHVDFAGPIMGKMLFVITDTHSKWPEVCVMSTTTSAKTIVVLRDLCARYGLPNQLVSDNGPQFTSDEFRQFCQSNGVKHIGLQVTEQPSDSSVQ